MNWDIIQAQSYLHSYDRAVEEELEERENKFCEECGTTLDLQEEDICLTCLEEA